MYNIVMRKKQSIKNYKNTSVQYTKSQAEIGKILSSHGITNTQFTNVKGMVIFVFSAPDSMSAYKIKIPVDDVKNLNQIYRILFNYIKSKFLSLDIGLIEFEKEFMSYRILPNGETAGEFLIPQMKGKDFDIDRLMLGDGR